MSDQEEGKGHHVTTMHAVRHLFERIPGERLLGQTPQEFFNRLDAAQGQVDGMPFASHSSSRRRPCGPPRSISRPGSTSTGIC